MSLLILIIGLALIGSGTYLFVSTLLYTSAGEDILAQASGENPTKSSPIIEGSKPLIKSLTLHLAVRVKDEEHREKIRKQILSAGLSKELTVDEFIGMQFLWGILFPVLLVIFNFAFQLGLPYWACIGFGLFGFLFPQSHCKAEKNNRHKSIQKELPFFVDLLALSTEAGMDFIGAIDRICSRLGKDSILGQELQIVLRDIRLGASRKEALRSLAERVDMNQIVSFCATVIDATETGVSIAQVLKDQSTQMRVERFSLAEKKGGKASQMILLPMVLFILPAIFIIVFAPSILGSMYGN